jgi:hypothetical protein
MAFPGTYNFNYYRGDTFEFIIRPKDGSGGAFPLSGYSAIFTMANKRGVGATKYTGTAVVNTADNIITCTIPPSTGRSLTTPPTPANWVYDVQMTNGSVIYTILNGSITVTDDITGAD